MEFSNMFWVSGWHFAAMVSRKKKKRNIDEKTHAVLDVVPMCLACSGDFF